MASEVSGNHCFTWKIENYSLCPQKVGETLDSPHFTTENVGNIIWQMCLYNRGLSENFNEYVYLAMYKYIHNIIDDVSNIDVKVEIVEANGNIIKQIEDKNEIFNSGTVRIMTKVIRIHELEKIMEKWEEDTLILRCTIVNRKKLLSSGLTKIEANRSVFKWDVETKDGVFHPMQKMFSTHDASLFELNLIPSSDDIKLSICKKDLNKNFNKTMSCRISLLDINGGKVHSKKAVHTFESEEVNSDWEFPTFLSLKLLKESSSSFINGIFTLLFDISVSKNESPLGAIDPACNNYKKNCNILSLKSDFKKLYCNDSLSDVQLKVEGKTFQAHRCILAARSDVFSAMFSQDMLETRTGIINIPDVEADVFESFLKYMYSAEVDNMSYEVASKLMIIADKYQVRMLKQHCSYVLRSQLTKDNAYDVLTLVDAVNYKALKAIVFDFICEHAKEMLTSSNWGKWAESNAKLAAELMSSIAINSEIVPRKINISIPDISIPEVKNCSFSGLGVDLR